MLALLTTFSWQELRHHPWRNAAAVAAIMLGVALAFSVALINASALGEFTQAVRSLNGEPDLELRAAQGRLDEALYARVATDPAVALASPVLEATAAVQDTTGARVPLRVLGVDALLVAAVARDLAPQPVAGAGRFALFAPDAVFLNAAARAQLPAGATTLVLQPGNGGSTTLDIAGSVQAAGAPLAVMDIGAAQDLFGLQGGLSRIDLRLREGADADALLARLRADPRWGAGMAVVRPGDAAERAGNLSRAYRVNLTALALVALFTGGFLVFSVLSLGVAKRAQQFALLGVLGCTGRERLRLVLAESAVLGGIGSLAGLALGSALAWTALHLLGGDLGGGYFTGGTPALQWDAASATLYGLLGLAAALLGGWIPARAAQQLPPAQTLKGLGLQAGAGSSLRLALALLAAAVVLAFVPPVAGIPLPAYAAIALLLVGGITALPALTALLYDRLAPRLARWLLPLLAVERARRHRATAAVAVSGVVAALALAVALTVMVASFRASVSHWLDIVLPADLYVRPATAGGSTGSANAPLLPPAFVQAVGALPGVARVQAQRTQALQLNPTLPAVALLARALPEPARNLPLVGELAPVTAGSIAVFVSEPMVDLYGARLGQPLPALAAVLAPAGGPRPTFVVAGIWRDYARQFGSIAIDRADYLRLGGDTGVSDLALWLAPGAAPAPLQQALRDLAARTAPSLALEFAAVDALRATSLRIFDRSFAVTYWLQAVAIAIGLFGIAASFSAQVLARRKEFGLLAHLGFTRTQVLRLVAAEGLAWTAVGSIAGLALGLCVSVVLVHVVNPQSFHWSMDLLLPWPRLLALCAATVLAGTATAWVAARAAAGRDAVLAVKEDW